MTSAEPAERPLTPERVDRALAWFEQHRFLISFAVLASFMGMSVGMAQITTSLYAVQLAASPTQLGLIAAGQSIGVLFMSLPTGILVDRYGPRRPFFAGTLLVGLLYIAAPLVASPLWLLLCTALVSFAMPMRSSRSIRGLPERLPHGCHRLCPRASVRRLHTVTGAGAGRTADRSERQGGAAVAAPTPDARAGLSRRRNATPARVAQGL